MTGRVKPERPCEVGSVALTVWQPLQDLVSPGSSCSQLVCWAVMRRAFASRMSIVNGTFAGTWMAVDQNFNASFPLVIAGWTFPGYTAVYTLILNLIIAVVLTPVFNVLGGKQTDQTAPTDYYA